MKKIVALLTLFLLTACQPQVQTIVETRIVETIVTVEGKEVIVTTLASAPATDHMYFEPAPINPAVNAATDNLSTFAMDVDTGSYTLMRRYIQNGTLPPPESVRPEEYLNYFNYQYPIPTADDLFYITMEAAPSPYAPTSDFVVQIGLQGYAPPPEARPDNLLIFVVDISGSMDRGDRLGQVKQSLKTLVAEMRPTDRIGIVVYGSSAYVHLEPIAASEATQINRAIDRLRTNGATNAEQGIQLGYQLAAQYQNEGETTQLILCSDGVANVGETTANMILEHAAQNIPLHTFGFGMGNYNDGLMEQLANKGDGRYAYIDSPQESDRVFRDQLNSTLFTIAKDAKIQVEFNPEIVESYRLIGYDNRALADDDFRDDHVDAGEIGAGHQVTALYELTLKAEADPNLPALSTHIRYFLPDGETAAEQSATLMTNQFHDRFTNSSSDFQLASLVAAYAELLRGNNADLALDELIFDARRITEYFPEDEAVLELRQLITKAANLTTAH